MNLFLKCKHIQLIRNILSLIHNTSILILKAFNWDFEMTLQLMSVTVSY